MERAGRLVASLGISYWGPEDAINSCLNALAGLLTHRSARQETQNSRTEQSNGVRRAYYYDVI